MSSSVETLIERVLGELHRIVQTETVIGTPVQAGDLTLIPVSKISFGFGAGGGQEGKGQSGTGGGANGFSAKSDATNGFGVGSRSSGQNAATSAPSPGRSPSRTAPSAATSSAGSGASPDLVPYQRSSCAHAGAHPPSAPHR